MQSKDIEYKHTAVDNRYISAEIILDILYLSRRQLGIKPHRLDAPALAQLAQLLDLSAADIRPRIRLFARLNKPRICLSARCIEQPRQLVEHLLGLARAVLYSDKNRPRTLAVLGSEYRLKPLSHKNSFPLLKNFLSYIQC